MVFTPTLYCLDSVTMSATIVAEPDKTVALAGWLNTLSGINDAGAPLELTGTVVTVVGGDVVEVVRATVVVVVVATVVLVVVVGARLVDVVGDGTNLDSAGNPIYDPYPNDDGFNVAGVRLVDVGGATGVELVVVDGAGAVVVVVLGLGFGPHRHRSGPVANCTVSCPAGQRTSPAWPSEATTVWLGAASATGGFRPKPPTAPRRATKRRRTTRTAAARRITGDSFVFVGSRELS